MHSKVQPAACQMQLSICSAGQAEERRSGRAAHGVGGIFSESHLARGKGYNGGGFGECSHGDRCRFLHE